MICLFSNANVMAATLPDTVKAKMNKDYGPKYGLYIYFAGKQYSADSGVTWHSAYCTGSLLQDAPVGDVSKNTSGVYRDVNATKKSTTVDKDPRILYFLKHPIKDKNDKTDYYQNQILIWRYLGAVYEGYLGYVDRSDLNVNVYKNVEEKIEEAEEKAPSRYPTVTVSITSDNLELKLNDNKTKYISGTFTVKLKTDYTKTYSWTPNVKLKSYTATLNNAPSDAEVIKDGSKFHIEIPVDKVDKTYDNIEVAVKASITMDKAYEYWNDNKNVQPIVLVTTITDTITKTSSSLKLSLIQNCNCSSDDVACAIEYCDETTKVDQNERDACVRTTCKIKEHNFAGCAPGEYSGGATGDPTICAANTVAEKKTCIPSNGNTYYKAHCTEKTTAHFNDSLPSTLKPGMGFSYSVQLNGSKVCDLGFDAQKWNYDYARANDEGRIALQAIRSKYLNMANEIKTYTDGEQYLNDPEKYLYNANDAQISINIKEKIDYLQTTDDKDINLNRVIEKKSSVSVINEGNFNTVDTDQTKYDNKKITSEMKSIYSLPEVCIDGATGKVYKAEQNNLTMQYECNKTSDGPYTKFFTNLKAKIGSVINTIVTITKESSGMTNLKNACYYQITDKPLTCVIEQQGQKYTLKVNSDYDIDYNKLEYQLTTNLTQKTWQSGNNTNNILATTQIGRSDYIVYGKIRYIGTNTILATCSKTPQGNNIGNTCGGFAPQQYSQIMKYCQENWHNDKDNYISEKSCYDTCTGINSCKVLYTCDQKEKKEQFCKNKHPNILTAEYRTCINECACSDGQAVYRPISLANPFPNSRDAGSNWQGYESNIKPLEESHMPEYVIELSANDIAEINRQTDAYNDNEEKQNAYIDYVWAKGSNDSGKYVSKFIHETNSDMFCIIDGEGNCD